MASVPSVTAADDLTLMVLGPLRAIRGGREVDLGPPRQRALLAALLVDIGHSVPVPVLLDRLWGNDPPPTATKSVQKYVSALRRSLGSDRIVSQGGYRLAADPGTVDSVTFESTVAEARALTSPAARAQHLERALALWRGEPFADLPEPLFLEPVRHRLEEERLAAREERLAALLRAGAATQVAVEAGELVAAHPLRERLWQLRMESLAATGRQAEALREYQRLRRALGEELGIEPSPESAMLEERILLQEAPGRPSGGTGNLPTATSPLIAREADLETVDALLERSRLVTLVGTGGVGKTSLALETARRRARRHAHGAWAVFLAPVADPGRVVGRAVEALGVAELPDRTLHEALELHLAPREVLLVVDNCEHVVEAAATLVAAVLRCGPGVTVLATSRQPLSIAGESVVVVDPLPVPAPGDDTASALDAPAVRLLVTRANEAGARLGDVDAVASSLAEISRDLDGIPLALELAAARLRAIAPRDLAGRIAASLRVGAERRDVPDRQRTLEATIDWSYRLLTTGQQELFASLAVFRGGFTLAAAEQVCREPGADVAEALAVLVDRSLVQVATMPDGSVRYHLLRTIRQFALDRLSGADTDAARRHAGFYTRLAGAAAATGPTDPEHARRIAADYENIRAALEYHVLGDGDRGEGLALAVALGGYWSDTGANAEAQMWLERALEAAPGATPALRARALLAASVAHQPSSSERALRASTEAVALAQEAGEPALLGSALCSLGRTHAIRVERAAAMPVLDEALAIFETLGDRWGVAECHEALGVAHRGSPEALSHYRRAEALYREIGSDADLSAMLFSMAYRSLIPSGRYDEARAALDEAAALSARDGLQHHLLHARTALAQLTRLEGDREAAKPLLAEALDEARALGDRRCTIRMLTALGRIAVSDGDPERARQLLSAAVEVGVAVDRGLSYDIHELMDALAILAWRTGVHDTAARWFGAAEATRIAQGLIRAPTDQAEVGSALAGLAAQVGDAALSRLTEAGSRLSFDEFAAEVRSSGAPV